jgi:hypothetical protein
MKPPPAKQGIIEPLDEKDLEQAEEAMKHWQGPLAWGLLLGGLIIGALWLCMR